MTKGKIALGLDVGSVSVKLVALLPRASAECLLQTGLARRGFRLLEVVALADDAVVIAPYRRSKGRPIDAIRSLLAEFTADIDADAIASVALTGSGDELLASALSASRFNDFRSLARAVGSLCPQVRTVVEIGGETSRFLHLAPEAGNGRLNIIDYNTNGDCAAGTGSFLDQQAGRLQYPVEQLGNVVATASRAAHIAGRCSVFAKSDMIHAQQKGFTPAEVLRGLCDAVATNYRSAVVKGRRLEPPVALVGGVSANAAVVRALTGALQLEDGQLFVPDAAEAFAAVGAALLGRESPAALPSARPAAGAGGLCARLDRAANHNGQTIATSPPLNLDRVRILRHLAAARRLPDDDSIASAYLGLDVGSVGTKLVVIDGDGELLHDIFTRTDGRPIEVVARCLRETQDVVGGRVRICGVGATGSGRELIGALVGADTVNDEITAHMTGATFVGDRLVGARPDTIFEIGGQDSKYISVQPAGDGTDGTVVVDFTMNEACAAGTGSFLEERAEELGVAIKDEFSRLALAATAPIKLGERCTVFMERDVNACLQRGAKRDDVIAGLAYSVAYNYINRVVRGRRIGECIFFQGGTAYNDAVAAAFSMICGKQIIVPPHNAVLGAIGAALLAKEKTAATGAATCFRGFNLSRVNYTLRELTCRGCGNRCAVQEFNVSGERTYWGDKCSQRFRKQVRSEKKPVIPDLVALRKELLHVDDTGDDRGATRRIGIPAAMYTLNLLPLWRGFFRECGFKVVVSPETNRQTILRGLDNVVAEPCFPIIAAHGHAAQLVDIGVDDLWIPNILSVESACGDEPGYVCPWGQTLPFVLRQAPMFRSWPGRILCPTLRLGEGADQLRRALADVAVGLGVSRSRAQRAFAAAVAAQRHFEHAYGEAGAEALAQLQETGESGIVLVGRAYNIHDPGVNLSVASKLRDLYGVNVIPIDALPLAGVNIRDVNDNMFWEYGRRILAAAKIVRQHPNLHIVYITNFKCGPDSFIKSFVGEASAKPFLTLQFDGHSNDAGTMTRCEAYLDSKGILRWWRSTERPQTGRLCSVERSTYRKCPMLAPD